MGDVHAALKRELLETLGLSVAELNRRKLDLRVDGESRYAILTAPLPASRQGVAFHRRLVSSPAFVRLCGHSEFADVGLFYFLLPAQLRAAFRKVAREESEG